MVSPDMEFRRVNQLMERYAVNLFTVCSSPTSKGPIAFLLVEWRVASGPARRGVSSGEMRGVHGAVCVSGEVSVKS